MTRQEATQAVLDIFGVEIWNGFQEAGFSIIKQLKFAAEYAFIHNMEAKDPSKGRACAVIREVLFELESKSRYVWHE